MSCMLAEASRLLLRIVLPWHVPCMLCCTCPSLASNFISRAQLHRQKCCALQLQVFMELHRSLEAGSSAKPSATGDSLSPHSQASTTGSLALCNSPAVRAFESPDDRQFLLSLLLHCADISNPVKPPVLSRRWGQGCGFESRMWHRDGGLLAVIWCHFGVK